MLAPINTSPVFPSLIVPLIVCCWAVDKKLSDKNKSRKAILNIWLVDYKKMKLVGEIVFFSAILFPPVIIWYKNFSSRGVTFMSIFYKCFFKTKLFVKMVYNLTGTIRLCFQKFQSYFNGLWILQNRGFLISVLKKDCFDANVSLPESQYSTRIHANASGNY